MEMEKFSYDNGIVRKFLIATVIFGVVGMLVGLLAALQLVFPSLGFATDFLTFGRIRPLHTNAVIFAFVGNGIFAGVYYSLQRLLKSRMWSDLLSNINFWGWQLIIVSAVLTLPFGYTTGKEYAELEWPIDIAMFGQEQEYVLINVYEEPRASVSSMVSLRDILSEASNDSLVEEKHRLSEKHPNLKISTESIYGDPNKAIVLYSTQEEAMQSAKMPVFVVPESYQFDGMSKVLLAVDLVKDDTHIVRQFVLSMLKKHKSKLTILTVTEDEDKIELDKVENAYTMHNSLEDIEHDFDVIEGEEVSAIIQNYARENDYDLVVTIPREAPWFKRALNPSISKNLVEHLQKPMLALH